MAFTTWSTTDKSANVTLSGSNLIATSSSGGSLSGRSVDSIAGSNKLYWETTCNTWTNVNSGVGIANAAALVGTTTFTSSNNVNGCLFWRQSGIYVNGSNVIAAGTTGTYTSGNLICHALDVPNQRYWARIGAAGNWNGSGTANPATNVGGVDISSILQGGVFPLYAAFSLGATNEQVTANFGATAFTGTVPSGFTSGFTAGTAPADNVLLTQAALEEWGAGTPDARLTQAAIEEWGVTNPPMRLTQIAAEHWALPSNPPMAMSQAAIEQWAQVSSVDTAVALTQIAIEQWASVNAASSTSNQPVICIIN
jgi:hypothetical protein